MVMMRNLQSSWFVTPEPKPRALLRLFCLPYSGSGAFAYRSWPQNLPPQVELCAIQLPGRENRLRERPFTGVQPLVNALVPEIKPHLDKPFVIFGHSLGALLAFELARALRRSYQTLPQALLVSGRGSPRCELREEPIHALPDEQFIDRLRDFNGTSEAVLNNQELMDLLLPTLRADFAINETYQYTIDSPLPCAISAYRGDRDPNMSYDDVADWRRETEGEFILRTLPGDHFFIHNSGALFWRMLAHDLQQALKQCDSQYMKRPLLNQSSPYSNSY